MKSAVFVLVSIAIALALVWWISPPQEGRVYDCSLAEFHPDYPKQVREECRKLMRNEQKNFI